MVCRNRRITHWKQKKNLENLLFYLFFEAESDIACVQTPPSPQKKKIRLS